MGQIQVGTLSASAGSNPLSGFYQSSSSRKTMSHIRICRAPANGYDNQTEIVVIAKALLLGKDLCSFQGKKPIM